MFRNWAEDNLVGYMAPRPLRVTNSPLLLQNKAHRDIVSSGSSHRTAPHRREVPDSRPLAAELL